MPLAPPIVSALTAGVLILMQMALMLSVVLARQRNRQSIGDGGKPKLLAAIRRHGNFAENAAIFIAGFALLEVLGGNRTVIATMCAAFVVGRISHAIGLSMENTVNPFRIAGVVITGAVGLSLGLGLIRVALSNLGVVFQ
jgi:uncharacterized membrane protein YecN with MAPEG domain